MAGPGQVKSGRHLRWYANGSPVGISRMKMLKPDTSRGLDKVVEAGNPDVVEYVKKVPETSLTLDYNVINYAQLALALGQSIGFDGTNTSGEVPDLPDNFDIVERMIVPGTEGTSNEQYQGFVIYQGIASEKDTWDAEVDKLVSVNLSAKCRRPRRFININGIAFDRFTANGATTAFTLANKARRNADGYYTIRVEAPLSIVLKETIDYTVASTSSSTTLTFAIAPASSSVPNVLSITTY